MSGDQGRVPNVSQEETLFQFQVFQSRKSTEVKSQVIKDCLQELVKRKRVHQLVQDCFQKLIY